jgi:hypothetical protein
MGLNDSVTSLRREADRTGRVDPTIPPGTAQVTLFGRENFQGRSIIADRPIGDLERVDFADRASSAVVRGGTWEVCDDVRFGGRCVTCGRVAIRRWRKWGSTTGFLAPPRGYCAVPAPGPLRDRSRFTDVRISKAGRSP